MRSLDHAKQQAREVRALIGSEAEQLLDRLRAFIERQYDIELIPVPAAVIDAGRAEVSPSERTLNYDERFERRPADLLWVLAHELGHLTMHQRLTRPYAQPDPLLGSVYLNEGAAAIARYSRRAREEAEANAFANEFIAPALDVFAEWRNTPGATTHSIAERRGVPEKIVRVQLAEALYQLLLSPAAEHSNHGGHGEARGEYNAEESPVLHSVPRSSTKKAVACDPRQLEAATFTGAPALVTAGPGTGKTATLVRRIEFLLTEKPARPDQFLVLTFSNDAAGELRERIAAKFGHEVAAAMEIATFHGFGLSFLHNHALGLSPDAAILDETGQEELIISLLGSLRCPHIINLRDPADSVKRIQRHINYLKDRVIDDQPITPELLSAAIEAWQPADDEAKQRKQRARELLTAFRAYERAKEARPAIDFADLIALPIRVLAARPRLVQKAREKYRWVLVDEYQDVSRTVALLLRYLCGPENPPWVVGDMRQAIYRFRGAAPENVRRFGDDFPGAQVFGLDTNYRSCPEVIHAANQLATLMELMETGQPVESENGDGVSVEVNALWRAGTDLTGIGENVVALARARADASEYDGIAAQVRAWLEMGVAPKDIAVLARRNSDVRNIVLALGERGMRATTSGLITPEGAAGDLAAIATFPDDPLASLPRVIFSLGRGRYEPQRLNQLVSHLINAARGGKQSSVGHEGAEDTEEEQKFPFLSAPTLRALRLCCEQVFQNRSTLFADQALTGLIAEFMRLGDCLAQEYFSGDAFSLMCAFLFNGSDYLRRVLDDRDAARRVLRLSEIATSLSRAAAYRFTHPDKAPVESRLAFAQHFRDNLSGSKPSLQAPHSEDDAVRVMTCHASKGLEFPCVVVAGQTLTQAREEMWLPDELQPSDEDERAQADALLFVGMTRAKRAVVVSCAETRSGTERARSRTLTPLLERWQQLFSIPTVNWSAPVAERDKVVIEPLWGGSQPPRLFAGSLDESSCAVRTYLESYIDITFPASLRSLYPVFYSSLRAALETIVQRVHESNSGVSADEAAVIFTTRFTRAEVSEHPHYRLYLDAGIAYTARFAEVFAPQARVSEFFDPAELLADTRRLPLRFDLVSSFRTVDGLAHIIVFRPESLAKAASKGNATELVWSGLKAAHRVAFVLLRNRLPELQPWVYSAADGVLYRLLWNRRPDNMTTEAERVTERWRAITHGRFEAKPNERNCDCCPARIACPHWLDAI
jgi:superfamily I DNA/RNA helicase/Zn-dependent peptidase ImmA (M78 family)